MVEETRNTHMVETTRNTHMVETSTYGLQEGCRELDMVEVQAQRVGHLQY